MRGQIGSRVSRQVVLSAAALCLRAGWLNAQPAALPRFESGEKLVFRVTTDRFGARGSATMWVEGPETLRGVETLVLHSDVRVGLGPFRATSHTQSWLDPRRMATLRFASRHRQPFSSSHEEVEVYPEERRWSSSHGTTGTTDTNLPLDELAFIYFLRTLSLSDEAAGHVLYRHYDSARNPSLVRYLGRESVQIPEGEFVALVLELTVREPRCTSGEGTIRVWLSDDETRRPLRIESRMPGLVSAVFTLESHSVPLARPTPVTP